MPSRKQRRRQQKLRRHEWEEVWVDAEGRELDPEEAPVEETQSRRAARASSNGKPRTSQQRPQRAGRVVEPPSWRRVLKRGAIFAPIMFLVVYFLKPKDATTASLVFQTAFLLVFFIPFSYLMDVLMYRQYRRRTERADGGAAKRR